MSSSLRVRSALVAALVAGVGVAGCPAAVALPAAPGDPSPSAPSQSDVDAARDAAEAVSAEVADLTARLEAAGERLVVLQEDVAAAVTAQEDAQRALARAESAAESATSVLADARADREAADRALAGHAALMYMQGGDLQNLTAMIFTPPNGMSDVSLLLDAEAGQVRQRLDDATAAAAAARVREAQVTFARDARADALATAEQARKDVAREAKAASAEAAGLGDRQEELTARLEQLQEDADDLAARRELAARLPGSVLLGLQAEAGSGPREAQDAARAQVTEHGWDTAEFDCLVTLWHFESGWSWSATNPSSGAYGIPQSLPGWKMASAGDDWLTNPETQIRWGLGYIETTYGSPCKALDAFSSRSPHWY